MSKKENNPSNQFHNFMKQIITPITEDNIEGYKYWFRRKIVTKFGYKKADTFDYNILDDYFKKGFSVKDAFDDIFNKK